MPLICTDGATNAGGAVFHPLVNPGPSNPRFNGGQCILVGDTAYCPAHGTNTTVTAGSLTVTVVGVPVALIGSPTSCGHPMATAGTNVSANAAA